MGRSAVVTTQRAPWHWQDKFDVRDPVDAQRQQLLKIEKQISFARWLRQKRMEERQRNDAIAAVLAAKRDEAQQERDAKEKERKEHKRRARVEAQQRRESRAEREQADARQREAAKAKSKRMRAQHDTVKRTYTDTMRCAPSASKAEPTPARPTFKQWVAKKKREGVKSAGAATSSAPLRPQSQRGKATQAAYEEWLARKQLEDRVKHKTTAEAKAQRALDAKRAHERTWQKKAVVCAYSQNQSDKEPAWRTVALS